MTVPASTAVPRTIGRYRIDGVLGEGAMAVVYAGYDPGIQRRVAIKCLHRHVADDAAYRRRFLAEARAAGHLMHPNIVTIFDAGETEDGRTYIAMERLDGETLASRVASEGLPPLPMVIELASQMAAALDYAHGQGVIHHDIKPENIMLAEGWHYAKLSDFGIAERRGARTTSDAIGGTPAYMALERLRGEPDDARSDLFSLGVVLHWLITGKLPWRETVDVPRLIRERQHSPRPAIEPLEPATPSMLVNIVRTLLAPAADARYQSGAEVVDDLRQARREYERLHEKPIANRIISLRLRWAAALGATLCLVLLVGLAVIYAKQSSAVTGLALDFGSSLGRIVAGEASENLLLGDQAATRALVQDIAKNRQIRYLAVADHLGEVVASTQPSDIGRPLVMPTGQKYLPRADGIDSYRSQIAGGDEMLLFDVPIRYQAKLVGDLRLGISETPLHAAQRMTLWVILAVLLVTLVAVVGAAYWLFRRPLVLLQMLSDALLRVGRGDFHHRIRLVRRDELGQLFAAFNLMNSALQARQQNEAGPSTAPRVATDHASQPTRIIQPPDAGQNAPE
ncbi:serine/threonine protein kinase [Rhodanobacter sp. C06]|uniref:protein kinase domain-containing protein n=1 Tax=Rhodanobacter sp. C06 TaxID=1945854 RepID=UPI0009C4443C|nr:protein kinase [Rhodanobacter sp. C06]OOG35995.1 serine/threonine protein kinase [Rhodanobacter sp. C06]